MWVVTDLVANNQRDSHRLSGTHNWGRSNKLPLQVRTYYAGKNLQAFDLLEIEDTGAAANTSKVKIVYEEDGRDVERTVNFRLIHEDATGRLTPRGKSGGRWVLYTYFV